MPCPEEKATRILFFGSMGPSGVMEAKKPLWYLESEAKSRNWSCCQTCHVRIKEEQGDEEVVTFARTLSGGDAMSMLAVTVMVVKGRVRRDVD
jgi:hypothetical protein